MSTTAAGVRNLISLYLAPYRRSVAILALTVFGTLGLRLLNPAILSSFIDQATRGAAVEALTRQALLFLAAAIALQVLAVLENWCAAELGLRTTNRLRADLARHALSLEMAFHAAHTPGEMIERVDGDVGTLADLFSRFVVDVVGSVLLVLAVLVLMFTIDWLAGVAFTVFCAITFAVMMSLRDVAVSAFRNERRASAELFGFLEERLVGTEDVRANGAVGYVMRRLFEKSRPVWHSLVGASTISSAATGSARILFAVGTALALGIGAYLYTTGIATIGTVFLLFRYSDVLSQPLDRLARQLANLQQAGASAIRIGDLLSTKSRIRDDGTRQLPSHGALSLTAEKLTFAYVESEDGKVQNAVSQVDFRLEAGRVLGLLGRTGSGKTSLARLALRLYEPQGGRILVGEVPVGEVSVRDLRRRVAYVTQDVQLFDASLRENLTLFDESIDDARILGAFSQLELREWLATFGGRLDARLSGSEGGLSAGEAQLIALVRAFLRDPGLIVLDEATSRLDPITERRLGTALARLLAGRTAVIIAHRLETVERADMILILEHGRQVEFGERASLAGDSTSRLYGLLRAGAGEELA